MLSRSDSLHLLSILSEDPLVTMTQPLVRAVKSKPSGSSEPLKLVVAEPNLLDLPVELIYKILQYLPFQMVAKQRVVCRTFQKIGSDILNREFNSLRNRTQELFQSMRNQMPRRESARRKHQLARGYDIVETMNMRLTLLQMTFSKHISRKHCCFFPGEILDEVHRILLYLRQTPVVNRAYKVTDELFDLSSMAMEYFKECLEPHLPDVNYLVLDYDSFPNGSQSANAGSSSSSSSSTIGGTSSMGYSSINPTSVDTFGTNPPGPFQFDNIFSRPSQSCDSLFPSQAPSMPPNSSNNSLISPFNLPPPPSFPMSTYPPLQLPQLTPSNHDWSPRIKTLEKTQKDQSQLLESVKSFNDAQKRRNVHMQKEHNRHQALLDTYNAKVHHLEEDNKKLKAELKETNGKLNQTILELADLKTLLTNTGRTQSVQSQSHSSISKGKQTNRSNKIVKTTGGSGKKNSPIKVSTQKTLPSKKSKINLSTKQKVEETSAVKRAVIEEPPTLRRSKRSRTTAFTWYH